MGGEVQERLVGRRGAGGWNEHCLQGRQEEGVEQREMGSQAGGGVKIPIAGAVGLPRAHRPATCSPAATTQPGTHTHTLHPWNS